MMESMRIHSFISLLAACSLLLPLTAPAQEAEEASAQETQAKDAVQETMQWWREARLGMFIHYGLYSGLAGSFQGVRGGGEWIQTNLGLDTDTYAATALPLFTPAEGCTTRWAQLAKAAGCRYAVLTTKHHEGFALFDTKLSDYNAAQQTGRDVVREFCDSCREAGLHVGFYHSVIDWHQKDYDNTICPGLCYPVHQAAMLKARGIPRDQEAYCRYLHGMVRELLSNYGKVDILWWDYSQGAAEGDRAWKATELKKMCRELQPGIIMNNRLYAAPTDENGNPNGNFTTPEKRVPTRENMPTYDWESCMTVGHHWGYSINDGNFKSPEEVINIFEDCLAHGGNLLLNIGPRADGSVPEEQETVFLKLGEWMAVNSEAVYGSAPLTEVDLPEELRIVSVWDDLYVYLPARKPALVEKVQEAALPGEALAPQGMQDDSGKGLSSNTTYGETTEGDIILNIPASEIDNVSPSVLGQPDCTVLMERVENPDNPEDVVIRFIIPAAAWENAPAGLPVLKLGADD